MKPTITIAVIAMNHEAYVEQACRSILGQTYTDFNIVFVDNNSSDRTFEIADEIFKNAGIPYKGVKNTVNRNVSQNFNILVSMADGEYITFISADDWFVPDAIEKKIKFIENNNFDLMFSDGYKYIQETKETVVLYPEDVKKKVLSLDNYFWDAIQGNFLYSVGITAKRSVLVQNPFEERVWMEDWEISLRLSMLGYKLGFQNEKLFHYRVLKSSLSNNLPVMHADYYTIVDKFSNELKKKPKIYKRYMTERCKVKMAAIENKPVKDKNDLIEYAGHKKEYVKARYSFPKREIYYIYWSIKEMLAK